MLLTYSTVNQTLFLNNIINLIIKYFSFLNCKNTGAIKILKLNQIEILYSSFYNCTTNSNGAGIFVDNSNEIILKYNCFLYCLSPSHGSAIHIVSSVNCSKIQYISTNKCPKFDFACISDSIVLSSKYSHSNDINTSNSKFTESSSIRFSYCYYINLNRIISKNSYGGNGIAFALVSNNDNYHIEYGLYINNTYSISLVFVHSAYCSIKSFYFLNNNNVPLTGAFLSNPGSISFFNCYFNHSSVSYGDRCGTLFNIVLYPNSLFLFQINFLSDKKCFEKKISERRIQTLFFNSIISNFII